MAAVELADGVALSKTSFWRTISCSPSSGVVNSPPWSTSQKWSSIVSATAVASAIHDRLAGRLGEPDEGIGERGVVGGEGVVTSPWLAALVPGPPPPAVVGA